jgi:hypothetical protein
MFVPSLCLGKLIVLMKLAPKRSFPHQIQIVLLCEQVAQYRHVTTLRCRVSARLTLPILCVEVYTVGGKGAQCS